MPRPVYIICSESGSDDRHTNLVSHFNVLEKIHFFRNAPDQKKPVTMFKFRGTAVWMREDGDIGVEFEWEYVLGLPMSKTPHVMSKGTFSYPSEAMLWRCVVNYEGPPPIDGSGMLSIEHRVRPVNSNDEWIVQKFPLIIEEITAKNAIGLETAPR